MASAWKSSRPFTAVGVGLVFLVAVANIQAPAKVVRAPSLSETESSELSFTAYNEVTPSALVLPILPWTSHLGIDFLSLLFSLRSTRPTAQSRITRGTRLSSPTVKRLWRHLALRLTLHSHGRSKPTPTRGNLSATHSQRWALPPCC